MSKSPKTIFVLLIFLVVAMGGSGLGKDYVLYENFNSGSLANWTSSGQYLITNGILNVTPSTDRFLNRTLSVPVNKTFYIEYDALINSPLSQGGWILRILNNNQWDAVNSGYGTINSVYGCSGVVGAWETCIENSSAGLVLNYNTTNFNNIWKHYKYSFLSNGTFIIEINGTVVNTTVNNLSHQNLSYLWLITGWQQTGNNFLMDNLEIYLEDNNLEITSKNLYNNQSITNFSALINGTTYSTTNGTINTGLPSNSTELYNITISSNESGGYFNNTYLNYNISNDLSSYLTPLYYLTASYSGNQTYNSTNYARNLSYSLTYTCPTTHTAPTIDIYINGVYNSQRTFSCFDVATLLTGSYQHATEGQYNISFYYNTSYLPEFNSNFTGNQTFVSDLNNPTPTTNITIGTGFTSANANITLTCSDSIMYGNLTYNLTFNGINQFYGIKTNGTTQTNQTVPIDGTNTLIGKCSDLFGTSTSTTTQSTYTNTIYLIDEKTNSAFNVQNISGVKVFYDDNSTSYDFKAANTSILNFTALTTSLTKLRFELTYPSGDVVTRYVDMALVDGDLRVCANKDGVLHYAQLITSATNRAAVLKNVYSNCVVAQDYTRFTYQDTNVLRAFTIDSLYYLYTNVDGVNSYLASLDGGIASTYYNVDVLEFNAQRSDLDIIKSVITTEKTGENTTKILYLDFENDSVSTNMMVYRVNGSVLLTNITETSTPNEFYLTFDYTLLNITNGESFKIVVIKTLSDGSTVEATAYFNTDGSYGFLSPAFVFVLSILLVIFGLTFLSTKESMGWFGIAIMVAAIVVLALAPLVWYTAFLMTIEIIILLFIIILLVIQNYQTVT